MSPYISIHKTGRMINFHCDRELSFLTDREAEILFDFQLMYTGLYQVRVIIKEVLNHKNRVIKKQHHHAIPVLPWHGHK
jgi:hypothetical protein